MTNTSLDLGTQHSLPTDQFYGSTSVDTPRVNRSNHSPPVRKEKESDKFDGRSVEWKDFIVYNYIYSIFDPNSDPYTYNHI